MVTVAATSAWKNVESTELSLSVSRNEARALMTEAGLQVKRRKKPGPQASSQYLGAA